MMGNNLIDKIQELLKKFNLDGWLFYNFQNRNYIAQMILNINPREHFTRRWFYFIPKDGEPIKLLSRVEPNKLEHLEGKKLLYSTWKEMVEKLREILKNSKTIAMEYSRNSSIPYISIIDAGTYEIIKSLSVEIVSSADLVQMFFIISENEIKTHYQAGEIIKSVLFEVFNNLGKFKYEFEVSDFIYNKLIENNLTTDGDFPIFAIGENSSNPHYMPTKDKSKKIEKENPFLIDIWARLNQENSIYYDITWVGYYGNKVPDDYKKIFEIVKSARDLAVEYINSKLEKNLEIFGYEVDDVVRSYIAQKGYGNYFIHRTGHSIGKFVHYFNVNIDNFETHDNRRIINGCLFSIEPGIYIDGKFGIRLEIDVYIKDNKAVITTIKQDNLIII
jgi:Xaa-Pro dipeptidase